MILRAANGAEAHVLPFGATLQSLIVPDRDGRLDDLVLGHDDVRGYQDRRSFYGATIGHYSNRIAGGRFGAQHIPANDGPNALHGGADGFDRRMWVVEAATDDCVTLSLLSPDGDQGFAGDLSVQLTYRINYDGEVTVLKYHFEATTTAETPVSLTNHSFFNLGGNLRDAAAIRSVMGHQLRIGACRYLPTDRTAIPLGSPEPVTGTPFDFREPHSIGARIRQAHPQLLAGKGYDHNFCLDGTDAAEVYDPVSGRVMQVVTDQPGLQFYSGNFLDGTEAGKGGIIARMGDAFCLEPQAWPDSPNRPDFPDAMLRPGETYRHRTELRFTTR